MLWQCASGPSGDALASDESRRNACILYEYYCWWFWPTKGEHNAAPCNLARHVVEAL